MEPVTQGAPPGVGESVDLEVERLSFGADAIARYDGLTVFLPDAAPGDRVRARVTEVRPRFARAVVTDVLEPSSERVAYDCPVADVCGGCQWQHVSSAGQLAAKERAVRDALERIGGWDSPDVRPILPSPRQWRYRNKARYGVAYADGAVRAGYNARRTHELVPISTCPLNMEGVDRALAGAVRALGDGSSYADLANSVTALVARESAGTGEIALRLVMSRNVRAREFAEELASELACEFAGLAGVTVVSSRRGASGRDRTVWGGESVTEHVGPWRYHVSAASFFQVNPYATPTLVDLVTDGAGLGGGETGDVDVVDAYGGAGLFSVALARQAGSVALVERDRSAVSDARRSLSESGMDNVTVHERPVEGIADLGLRADVIVCDPPRQGAGREAIDAMETLSAGRFVYVACDPATLARDSAMLRKHGWDLVAAQPLDMFPQTYHVETVALFERR